MKGIEIIEALDFIDGRYIKEAGTNEFSVINKDEKCKKLLANKK